MFQFSRQQALVVSAAAATADEQKIRIKLRGYDSETLQESIGLISDAAKSTGARVSGPVYLPTRSVILHRSSRPNNGVVYSPAAATLQD